MYRSVLVPLDGTAFGEQALPLALEVARRTGAVLHLVHVHVPGSAWTPLEGMMPGTSAVRPLAQVEDRQYLERMVGGLAPATADIRVLEGPVSRSIAESAREAEVDLVVMSTHGRTGLSRLWHHDVAGYLTRHLSVPVLALPVHEEPAPEPRSPLLRRVLVPLGGRPNNVEVLDQVADFCQAFGGTAVLLRVVEPPIEVGYTLMGQDGHVNHYLLEDLDEEARRYLEGAAGPLRARGIPVELAVAHGASPGEAILEFVRGSAAGTVDVIALETHGLGTVRHLFAPSVVETVVHGAEVPVLLHHAHADLSPDEMYEEGIRARMGWHRAEPDLPHPVA